MLNSITMHHVEADNTIDVILLLKERRIELISPTHLNTSDIVDQLLILRDIFIVSPFQFILIIFNSIVAAFIIVIIRSLSVFAGCILLTSMEVTSSMMISLGC